MSTPEPRRKAGPAIPPKYLIGGLLAALLLFLLGFCSGVSDAGGQAAPAPASPTPTEPSRTAVGAPLGTPEASPSETAIDTVPGSALDVLIHKLEVKKPAAGTTYVRAKFGPAWKDVDKNGCDQRNDVLRRDLTKRHTKPGTHGCILAKGNLVSSYTGETVYFVRGQPGIQIDHVVALKNAWLSGASTWTDGERLAYANDFLNLLPVEEEVNQDKSDLAANRWLPEKDVCKFVARQVAVKDKYHLTVSAEEADAMTDVLMGCPKVKPPTTRSAAVPKPKPIGEPKPAPAPTPTPKPSEDPVDENYGTCAAAKAAGHGPYMRGVDPEYDYYRDQDGDGTVCE